MSAKNFITPQFLRTKEGKNTVKRLYIENILPIIFKL
jgi:hypothetical protein